MVDENPTPKSDKAERPHVMVDKLADGYVPPGHDVLDPHSERFAQFLADGLDAGEAYALAGYAGGAANGRRKKASPIIKRRVAEILVHRQSIIDQASHRLADKVVLTKEWVIERLIENVNRAMTIKEVEINGQKVGTFEYNGSVANAALHLLGKEVGMFKQIVGGRIGLYEISDQPLTADEWAAAHTEPMLELTAEPGAREPMDIAADGSPILR